ncbi:MAG: cyclic nucleotide-binding domain-containing protein [Polyangiaceae bacterium]
MAIPPAQLKQLPMFANITEAHIAELAAAFEEISAKPGEVLFEAGRIPTRFLILLDGAISLTQEGEERFVLRPLAPVGELGAITGLPRNMTATAAAPSKLLSITVQGLMDFCEAHGDVAFPVHHNLLHIVADKLGRDRRRIEEMRANLITTQKAMKRMREALLEADDTPLTKQLFEELDGLIEQNKRWHYLVEPPRALAASVRLDGGQVAPVLAMSKDRIDFAAAGEPPRKGVDWSAVLVTADREIPVSGSVRESSSERVVVALDLLIDDYMHQLEDYLTRVQMLDVVV